MNQARMNCEVLSTQREHPQRVVGNQARMNCEQVPYENAYKHEQREESSKNELRVRCGIGRLMLFSGLNQARMNCENF